MKDTRACRACLDTDGRLERIPDNWYRMFENLTGVRVSKGDGYPNYFCIECKSYIHKAIAFRKKSRRAFYVLKEIMMIRKEVNLPDIKTVNRSSANLKSSLEMWKPERTALYIMRTVEGEGTILEKQDLTTDKNRTVIEIRGEVGEVPEEPVEDNLPLLPLDDDHFNQADDHFADNSQDIDNTSHIKEDQKKEGEEIDMEDIFKGLPEPESEPESIVETKVKKQKKYVRRKKGEPKKVKVVKKKEYSALTKGRALINFDVKEISEEEQRDAFKSRTSNPIFTKALYTCGICVKVMPSADTLMAHFDVHMKKNKGPFLCKICKDKFMTAEDFELHSQENHLYKYICKICQDVTYTIRDMVKHKREKHIERHRAPKEDIDTHINYEAELFEKFLVIPIPEEEKEAFFKKNAGVGKFCCDICGIGLPTGPLRQTHREMHLKKPKNPNTNRKQCPHCGVWCSKGEHLQKHMESFHNYYFHCKLCSYEAPNRSLAEDHLTRAHSKITNVCHICGLSSKTVLGLQSHVSFHHYALLYNKHCVLCGNGFKSDATLYFHQFKEHKFFKFATPPVEGAENTCTHCNVQFMSQKAYFNHLMMFNHEEAKIVPWKCMTCRKLFDSEADLRDHSISSCKILQSVFPMPCQVCGDMLSSNKDYYLHCLKKHNRDAYLLTWGKLCHICGKTYTDKQFKQHECFSEDFAKYKCSVCDIVFRKAKSVVFHVLQKHMKKPFICTICNNAFRRRYDCKDHILKVHAPVKPYTCPLCNRDFSHIDFLKKHALDLHDVKVELDGKPKKKEFLFIYPNMKMDLSLIDKSIVDDMLIKVADYTDQIYERIQDYSDYIITNEDVKKKVEAEGQDCKNFIISADTLRQKHPEEQNRKFLVFNEDEAKIKIERSTISSPTRPSKYNMSEEEELQDCKDFMISVDALRRKQQKEQDRKCRSFNEGVAKRKKERPTTSKLSRPKYNMPYLEIEEGNGKDFISAQALKRKHQEQHDRKYLFNKSVVKKQKKEQPSTSTPSHHVFYNMPTLEEEEEGQDSRGYKEASFMDRPSTSVLSRHLKYKSPRKKIKVEMFNEEL